MKKPIGLGLCLWFLATLSIRIFGKALLDPSNTASVMVLFLSTAVGLFFLLTFWYHLSGLSGTERRMTGAMVALPGMILDIFSLAFFPAVFPNLNVAAQRLFAAWLFFAYSCMIGSGLIPGASRTATR